LASENQNIYYRLYQLFNEQYVQWAYCGDFTSEKTDLMIRFFENFLQQENIILKIQRRAFYIFVEGIQNVHRHQLTPESTSPLQRGFLLFQQQVQHLAFTMGNIIENSQEKFISSRLDTLNKMSREELNNYYKKILKNDVLSEKGGAGLGLIEIARKSENILNYHFMPLDDRFSFFYLRMVVSGTEANRMTKPAEENAKYYSDLHHALLQAEINLSFHEDIPSRLPNDLLNKTNIILPDDFPEWSGNILFSVIEVLHKVFPERDLIQNPAYVFCQSYDVLFNLMTGVTVSRTEAGNVNQLVDVLRKKEFKEIKIRMSKPPKIQISDISESKQFITITFSFSL